MTTLSLWNDNEAAPLAVRHEQLRRTSQAMWRLLKLRLDLSDEELHHALTRVDKESLATVQVQTQLLDCSVCRHPVISTAKCCLYCGTAPQAKPRSVGLLRTRHIQQ